MASGFSWTYDELVLVLDFYMTHGAYSRENKREFDELADLVAPHPAESTRRQVSNFLALDPTDSRRGLPNVSRKAKDVWHEFKDNPKKLRREARKIRKHRNQE